MGRGNNTYKNYNSQEHSRPSEMPSVSTCVADDFGVQYHLMLPIDIVPANYILENTMSYFLFSYHDYTKKCSTVSRRIAECQIYYRVNDEKRFKRLICISNTFSKSTALNIIATGLVLTDETEGHSKGYTEFMRSISPYPPLLYLQ